LQRLFDNRQWDEFVDKYRAIERHEAAFPRMMKNRRRALLESAHQNMRHGRAQAALRRDPSNKPLQEIAEQKRLETALASAKSRSRSVSPESAEGVRFARHINLGSRYLADKNYTEAERELNTAAGIDQDSPSVHLLRARLYKERNRLVAALAALNDYDERASEPADRRAGEELRIELLYNLNKQRTEARQNLSTLYSEHRYKEGLVAATKALELDPRDPEFLWHAGLFSAVLRSPAASRLLADYLEVTNSLAADPARRRLAWRVMSLASSTVNPSGCPAGAIYCPDTLMFQPRIASIRARDVTQTFEYSPEGRLIAIRRPSGPSFTIDYFPGSNVISRVATDQADVPAADVSPLGNPTVNMQVIALLEGRTPTTGVAGNPYFNPFVWSGLHRFDLVYDESGRVEQASEIGTTRITRFQWDGNRLQNLAVFADKDTERPVYRRSLSWAGDRLTAENVEYGGRQYKITYKYVGDRLTEAEFDDSGAHDGLARTVRFQ
jgi:tetratricopeptide (TPR) repeat protein